MKDTMIELWIVILRTIWIAIFVGSAIGLLRLMAWSDTDMHGDGSKIEKSFIP